MKYKFSLIFTVAFLISIFSVYGTITSITPDAPADNDWTADTTPQFNFTAVSNVTASFSCELFSDGISVGSNASVQNNTYTTIISIALSETSHSWYVNCTDPNGTTQMSPSYTLNVDATSPDVSLDSPADSATIDGDSSVTFNFTGTDNLNTSTDFVLYLDGRPNRTGIAVNDTEVEFTESGFSDNTTYYWHVVLTDEAGNTKNSTPRSFTFNDNVAPKTAPTSVAVADIGNDGNLDITWTEDSNAATYNIYRSPTNITNATSLTKLASVATGTSSYQDNTTSHGTTYWYALTSVDAAGNENKSQVSNSENAAANDAVDPALPASVTASTKADGSVLVSWDAVVQDTNGDYDGQNIKYNVFRTTSVSGLNTSSDTPLTANTSSTTYTDTTITTGTNYSYVITAVDDAGNHNGAKTALDSIIPSACTTEYAYGSYGDCTDGTKTRSGTRTCYGGGDTTATQSTSCSSSSTSRRSSTDDDTSTNPRATWQWQRITPGAASIMKIYNAELSIKRIEINVSNPRQNVHITVEKLDGKPENVTKASDRVYKYLEITPTNLEEEDTGSSVEFSVSRSWLSQNSLENEAVVLMRYKDGKWTELETEIKEETDDEITYEATTPGFSYFAIAQTSQEQPEDTDTTVEEDTGDSMEERAEDVQEEAEEDTDAQEDTANQEDTQADTPEEGSNRLWLWIAAIVVIGAAIYYYGFRPKSTFIGLDGKKKGKKKKKNK